VVGHRSEKFARHSICHTITYVSQGVTLHVLTTSISIRFQLQKSSISRGSGLFRVEVIPHSALRSLPTKEAHWCFIPYIRPLKATDISIAVDFLLRNGFHFDRPYTYGVPYLSRKDEADINAAWIAIDKQKATLADMPIKGEDAVLVNYVRASVEKWQKQPLLTRESYLNIPDTSDGGVHYAAASQILSRYQIRLVHQIVRNEYPTLKTTGKGHFIQITPFDDARDMNEKLQQARYRERDISRAIEFRWLIEAICGGDITRMPSEYFINALPSGVNPTDGEGGALRKFIDDLQRQLNSRRRILVGHNCFMDLIYLYRCFIGELPPRLEDFQELIREMFPAVVDTKYIASFGESWQSTSLQEVEEKLPTEGVPRVEVPAEFDRYAIGQSLHEAGYDSLLTAKIAIKLSTKLEKEAKFPAYKQEDVLNLENATNDDDDDDGGVSEHYITAAESIADSEAGNLTAMVTNVLSAPITAIGNFFRSDLAATGQQFTDNHDCLVNDQLEDLMVFSDKEKDKGEEMELTEANGEGEAVRVPFQRTSTESLDHMASPKLPNFKASDKMLTKAEILEKVERGELMPRWEGGRGFWQYFGKKLQVNSAEEGICYL
jgi:CAF1 family ribonuclease